MVSDLAILGATDFATKDEPANESAFMSQRKHRHTSQSESDTLTALRRENASLQGENDTFHPERQGDGDRRTWKGFATAGMTGAED